MLILYADGGRKLVYGTESGVFIQDRRPKAEVSLPRQVLYVSGVTQIDMLEEYQLLLVLQNRNLWTYPLEVLESGDNPALKRGKKILNHVNFFKAGVCLGRHLVCCAKSSSLTTTVRVYEPMDTLSRSKGPRSGLRLFSSSQDSLKEFKASEFRRLVALFCEKLDLTVEEICNMAQRTLFPAESRIPANVENLDCKPIAAPILFDDLKHTRQGSSKLRGEAGEVTRPVKETSSRGKAASPSIQVFPNFCRPLSETSSSDLNAGLKNKSSEASLAPITTKRSCLAGSRSPSSPLSVHFDLPDESSQADELPQQEAQQQKTPEQEVSEQKAPKRPAPEQTAAEENLLKHIKLTDIEFTQELYVPSEATSIHFLKSKICVATARGFEVVSLETLERQPLLDEADTSLDFVAQEKETRPVHIERLNVEFLLNYTEFSFFVYRNGGRARHDWKITWEGQPNGFALSYPYILAFEPSFVDVRHVETSACVHIMTGTNIRLLHSSTQEVRPRFLEALLSPKS